MNSQQLFVNPVYLPETMAMFTCTLPHTQNIA